MTAALVAIGVAAVVAIAAFLRGRRPARQAHEHRSVRPQRAVASLGQCCASLATPIQRDRRGNPGRPVAVEHGIDHSPGATRRRGVLADRQTRRRARRRARSVSTVRRCKPGSTPPTTRRRDRHSSRSSSRRSEFGQRATTPISGCDCSTRASASSLPMPQRSASVPTPPSDLGSAVDDVVTQLESLRLAVEDINNPRPGDAGQASPSP